MAESQGSHRIVHYQMGQTWYSSRKSPDGGYVYSFSTLEAACAFAQGVLSEDGDVYPFIDERPDASGFSFHVTVQPSVLTTLVS